MGNLKFRNLNSSYEIFPSLFLQYNQYGKFYPNGYMASNKSVRERRAWRSHKRGTQAT